MLPSRYVFFTALEGALLDPASRSWAAAADALAELERRSVPWVLVTAGTRAQLDPLRRAMEHRHPFITESGGGLFLPDAYFSLRLEGALRVGRHFCISFGRPYSEAVAALEEIAFDARAQVVGYAQMSVGEIARNTGLPVREAGVARKREFSERFFFVGETDAAVHRFAAAAAVRGWDAVPGNPFWELRSGNDEGRAVRCLMSFYRQSLHRRLSSVGIGSMARDLNFLSAADRTIVLSGHDVLPGHDREFDPGLARALRNATRGQAPGPAGWSHEVLAILDRS